MRRCHSILSMFLAFVWAFMIVCSDDVLVYADVDCQNSVSLSSVIVDGTEVWSESNTDFVLQDTNTLRSRMCNRNHPSRIRMMCFAVKAERCELQLVQCRKYIFPLEIDQYLNEKIIMNYLHRQDGDK